MLSAASAAARGWKQKAAISAAQVIFATLDDAANGVPPGIVFPILLAAAKREQHFSKLSNARPRATTVERAKNEHMALACFAC